MGLSSSAACSVTLHEPFQRQRGSAPPAACQNETPKRAGGASANTAGGLTGLTGLLLGAARSRAGTDSSSRRAAAETCCSKSCPGLSSAPSLTGVWCHCCWYRTAVERKAPVQAACRHRSVLAGCPLRSGIGASPCAHLAVSPETAEKSERP